MGNYENSSKRKTSVTLSVWTFSAVIVGACLFLQTPCVSAQTLFFMSACGKDYPNSENQGKVFQDFSNDAQCVQDAVLWNFNPGEKKLCVYNDPVNSTSDIEWKGGDVLNQGSFEGILDAIDLLENKVESDDAVFLYWAGHGKQRTDGHYLTSSNGEIRRLQLIDRIREKLNPRLIVVITDACACYVQMRQAVSPRGVKTTENVSPLFDELFFKYSGIADINAADLGFEAIATTVSGQWSGIFSAALNNIFSDKSETRMLWEDFVKNLDSETTTVYNTRHRMYRWELMGTLTETDYFRQPDGTYRQPIGIWRLPQRMLGSIGPKKEKPSVVVVIDNEESTKINEGIWSSQDYYAEANDVIVRINGYPVTSKEQYYELLRASCESVTLKIKKHDTNKYEFYKADLLTGAEDPLGYEVQDNNGTGVVVVGTVEGMEPAKLSRFDQQSGDGGRWDRQFGNGGYIWQGATPIYYHECFLMRLFRCWRGIYGSRVFYYWY